MDCEMSMVERRFKVLRKHLDDLGYRQPLVIDALPLVERIISDLLHTTDSLQHYKLLAQQSLEECNQLGVGIEPYRQDNAKLVQETNDLHLKLLHSKEDADKSLKELRAQLRKLENENADLQFVSSQHLARVKALELESAEKSRKIVKLQGRSSHAILVTPGGKKKSIPFHRPTIEIDSPLKPGRPWQEQFWSVQAQAGDPYIAKMCDVSDQRINCLWREVNQLKEKCVQQSELITTYKNQLKNRDIEIERLSSMLEGGRPLAAVSNDSCFSDLRTKLLTLSENNKKLDEKNSEMERQLKEMVSKHRDATIKAGKLCDRNRQLEQEMHDIDHMALTVEAECHSTVKEHSKHVSKLKTSLNESSHKILDLEREILELKRNNQETQAEFDKLHNEKKNLQKILDTITEDKKRVTERTNNFTIIENDLNMEIDRLTRVTNSQKLQIAELQNQISTNETEHLITEAASKKSSSSREKKTSSKKSTSSKSSMTAKTSTTNLKKTFEEDLPSQAKEGAEKSRLHSPERSSSRLDKEHIILIERLQAERDLYFKEFHQLKEQLCNIPSLQNRDEDKDQSALIERLQAERDLYFKEFHELKGELFNIPSHRDRDEDENCSLRRKLDERTRELTESRQTIRELNRERTNLVMCAEAAAKTRPAEVAAAGTARGLVERLEHERDLARGDVVRLEEERAAVRDRLRIATETQVSESSRFEKLAAESEARIRTLEAERREWINGQAALKATINNVTGEMEEARVAQAALQQELCHQRMLYSQIKALHEQTDRALADSQCRLTQADAELVDAKEKVRETSRDRVTLDREVTQLKAEVSSLKRVLAQVDGEKDGLLIHIDEKTERAAHLEHDLKEKESKLKMMKDKMIELQTKLDVLLDENACQGQESRRFEAEVQGLRQEICSLQRVHENSLREIRRLTDDVAAAAQDSCLSRRELEQSRQECENLKRQLQDYVAEVRRVEELLQQKEGERSELLDHFRSLSQEATALETNNHSLGHVAEEAKTQLQCVESRVADLEMLVETKDGLVRNYEAQLADLTSHVACLENQLQAHGEQKSRLERDVAAVRDLCMKLDGQKAELIEANAESDAVKMHLDKELSRLREAHDELQDEAARDRCSLKSLECSLSNSRQETLDGRKSNQELKAEVAALHRTIDDLQQRLDVESSEVRRYQKQAAEYSQHVSDLRREVTNERFERARSIEETRRPSIPVCPCPRPGAHASSGYGNRSCTGIPQRPGPPPCICPPGAGNSRLAAPLISTMSTLNLAASCPGANRTCANPVQGGRKVVCLCPPPQISSALGYRNKGRSEILGCTCGPDDKSKTPPEVRSGARSPTADANQAPANAQNKGNSGRASPPANSFDSERETRPKELYQPGQTDNAGNNTTNVSSRRVSYEFDNDTRPKELYQTTPTSSSRPNPDNTTYLQIGESDDSDAENQGERLGPTTIEENADDTLNLSDERRSGVGKETLPVERAQVNPGRPSAQRNITRGDTEAKTRSEEQDRVNTGLPVKNLRGGVEDETRSGERNQENARIPPPVKNTRGGVEDKTRSGERDQVNVGRPSPLRDITRGGVEKETQPRDRSQQETADSRKYVDRPANNPRDGTDNWTRSKSRSESDSDSDSCDDEIALRISLQRKCDESPVEVDLLISNGQTIKNVSGGNGTDIRDRSPADKQKAVNVRQNVSVPVPNRDRSRSRSKSPKK